MNKHKIAILTDSGADVPESVKEQFNVKVIPLKIIFKRIACDFVNRSLCIISFIHSLSVLKRMELLIFEESCNL